MMKMSQVREYSFKFLYHINFNIFNAIDSSKYSDFTQETLENLDQLLNEFNTSYSKSDSEHPDNQLTTEVRSLGKEFIEGILNNFEQILSDVKPHINNGNLAKVEKIELCCLLIGTYELKHRETPKKVVINEVLNIGQKFGGASTPSFLNAVLDKIK